MKVAVTGGTGFVGKHLVKQLEAQRIEVDCYLRGQSDLDWKAYDAVYHLAGVLGKKGIPARVYREPAVGLTSRILNKMCRGQRFVFVSTQYVTLDHTKGYLKDYEIAKLEGEEITQTIGEKKGIKYRIVRPGFIYGEEDRHHLPLFQIMKKMGKFFPVVGDGQNVICPVYVGDVTRALGNCFGREEKVIPVAGEKVTMKNFLNKVAKALGIEQPRYHIPESMASIWPLRDWLKTEFFLSDQRKFSSLVETVSLEEGLSKCIEWYKEGR